MAEKPLNFVSITDFALVSNRGPFAGKPGAAKVMKNCSGVTPGQLESRRGFRPVGFSDDLAGPTSGTILSMCVFEYTGATYLITADAGGDVFARESPW